MFFPRKIFLEKFKETPGKLFPKIEWPPCVNDFAYLFDCVCLPLGYFNGYCHDTCLSICLGRGTTSYAGKTKRT